MVETFEEAVDAEDVPPNLLTTAHPYGERLAIHVFFLFMVCLDLMAFHLKFKRCH